MFAGLVAALGRRARLLPLMLFLGCLTLGTGMARPAAAAPTITSITPNKGKIDGQDIITINGGGFLHLSTVTFDGVAGTSLNILNDNQITITTPKSLAGAGPVDVTARDVNNQSATIVSGFTYVAPPIIISINATGVSTNGGDTVTLTGANLDAVTSVTFDGVAGKSLAHQGTTGLTVTTPAHPAGAVPVAVTSPGGALWIPDGFTYLDPPTITAIDPTLGPAKGGTQVTITGTNLTDAAVSFGGTAGTAVTVNTAGTSLTVNTPAHPAGAVDVTVTTPGGTAVKTGGFTYQLPVPAISTVSPMAGLTTGGYIVTITGTNLDAVTSVSFGGTDGTSLAHPDSSTLTVTAPAHPAGAVDIKLAYPGGTATSAGGFTYQEPLPTITSISPDHGADLLPTVTIIGSNFKDAYWFSLDATLAFPLPSAVQAPYTQITVTLPPHAAGQVHLAVRTPAGVSNDVNYTYEAPNLSFDPAQPALPDVVQGQTYKQLIIMEGGIGPTTYTLETGALPAGLSLVPGIPGSAGITGTVTAPPGLYTFTVRGTDSYQHTAAMQYTIPVTSALSFTPAAGGLPDATVGQTYHQTVTMNGGTGAVTYSLDGGTALPAGLTLDPATGLISGTLSMNAAIGDRTFTIRGTDTLGQTASMNYTITVKAQAQPAPVITALSVDHGPAAGGTQLVLTGMNFTGADRVSFGTVDVTNLQVDGTGTHVTVTSPQHAAGNVDLAVHTQSGQSNAVTYGFDAPTLTFNHPAGPLPDATLGKGYNLQFILMGATGPVNYQLANVTFLPPGLMLAADGNLTGMPTQAGDFQFSIKGTDANQQTATVQYSIRVNPAAAVLHIASITPSSGPVGQSVVITGDAMDTVQHVTFGGVDAGAISLQSAGSLTVTAPQHGLGAVNVIVASATQYDTKTNGFSYITDPGTLTFTPPGGALPVAFKNKAYSQQISVSGGMAPYTFDEGGKLPDGVTFNDKTGLLSGTPTAASVGDYSFDIEGIDAGGMTQTVSYTLKVADAPVTVPGKTVAVVRGQAPPPVDLTNGASGGPFTAAAIVSITPPQAGTATIMSDVPPQKPVSHASPFAGVHSFTLVFKPDPAFAGKEAKVTYRLTSAAGISGEGVVTYRFNAKPSVSSEEVSRVEQQVHGFVQARLGLLAENIDLPGLLERRQRGQADGPVTTTMTPSDTGVTLAYSTSLSQIEAADKAGAGGDGTPETLAPLDFWSSGKVLLTRGATGTERDSGPANAPVPGSGTGSDGEKWGTFALFSAGVDYLVSDRLLVGFSVHYDHDSDPLDQGTLITGNGWLAGPYASLQLAPHVFFDTSLLYGQSANSFTSTALKGDFDTTRWLWSGTLKGDMAFDNGVSLTPRLKAVYLAEKAGAYSAEDKDGNAYPLDAFTEKQIRLSIGAEIRKQYELANGVVLTPSLDAEAGFAGLDGGGAFGTLTAGLEADTPDNWQFYAGLLLDLSADGTLATGAKATAGKQF
nr:IPT/TIG domain-containing protein [uncultured Gellertiella sp.]